MAQGGAIAEAMEAGADGYVTKPIVLATLANEISRVLAEASTAGARIGDHQSG